MPKLTTEKTMWFDVPDDPLCGRVEIKHLKNGEIQTILAHNNKTETIFNGNKRPKLVTVQVDAPVIVQAAAAVVGWENHLDENDKPLDCTPENARAFLKEDGYLAFISDCRDKLAEIVAEEKKADDLN